MQVEKSQFCKHHSKNLFRQKSSKDAKDKAMYEFNKFRKIQDREYMSDFDKMIDEVKRLSSQ